MNLFRTPALLPFLYPQLVWRIPVAENTIFLTFDDGPVPGPTEFVLDELKKVKANGTFFCIGDNIRKHPDVFHRVVSEGNRVANHTYHHVNGWSTNTEEYIENVTQCERLLCAQVQGHEKIRPLFRPPYGRIKRAQIKKLHACQIIMWDVLTHDYNPTISGPVCLANSIKATRPGSIVVFHDSLKAEKNLTYVLPRYLDHFSCRGFTFGLLPVQHG